MLLVAGALLLIGSGVSALGLFASGSAPEGTIAEDSISVTVTDPTITELLPITGTQLGMLLGLALIAIAVGWGLVRRRAADREDVNV